MDFVAQLEMLISIMSDVSCDGIHSHLSDFYRNQNLNTLDPMFLTSVLLFNCHDLITNTESSLREPHSAARSCEGSATLQRELPESIEIRAQTTLNGRKNIRKQPSTFTQASKGKIRKNLSLTIQSPEKVGRRPIKGFCSVAFGSYSSGQTCKPLQRYSQTPTAGFRPMKPAPSHIKKIRFPRQVSNKANPLSSSTKMPKVTPV